MFIFSIHGLKFVASPDLPEPGVPGSGLSPQAAGYFLGATGPLPSLPVPLRCAGKKPQAGRRHPEADPACRDWLAPLSLAPTAVPPTPGVGGQGGGLLTVNARGLQLFNVRAQSPVPRGDSNGRGCPLPRRCVVTRGRCHQGAEVKTKSGSDFCRCLHWWCLSTCWEQKVLSHSVVSTCPWTGQPGSRVQWGR